MAQKSRFYRDTRNARCLGVCAGIADYAGVRASLVRVALVLMVLFGMPYMIVAYLVIGLVVEAKPAELYETSEADRDFWRKMRTNSRATLSDVGHRFRHIERRLRSLEAYTTSSSRDLEREIDRLRDA